MPPRFCDTNILLRYLTRDDEEKARRSLALLTRVEQGLERVETSLMVVFETVFSLHRHYRVPKARVRELLAPILQMRGFHVPNKNLCIEALDMFVDKNIDFADAFNAVYMKAHDVTEIYSWDGDFDKIEGIIRVEPESDN